MSTKIYTITNRKCLWCNEVQWCWLLKKTYPSLKLCPQLCSILSYPTQLPGHCHLHPHGWKEGPIIFWHNLPALCLQQQFIGTIEKKVKCYQVLNEVCYENVLNQESVIFTPWMAWVLQRHKIIRYDKNMLFCHIMSFELNGHVQCLVLLVILNIVLVQVWSTQFRFGPSLEYSLW